LGFQKGEIWERGRSRGGERGDGLVGRERGERREERETRKKFLSLSFPSQDFPALAKPLTRPLPILLAAAAIEQVRTHAQLKKGTAPRAFRDTPDHINVLLAAEKSLEQGRHPRRAPCPSKRAPLSPATLPDGVPRI
jgi:hypothetical protein